MLPAVVVLGQNLFGAFYSVLSRKLSVLMPHAQIQISAVLYTITMVVALPFAFWYGDPLVADLIRWWPYLLLGGLATALNGASIFFIFKYMDAAMGSLLMTTNVVMAVLAAMYVLGERMGLYEILGAAIVLLAVTYALSVHVNKRERRNWTYGILFTLASALLFSVAAVIEKFLLGEMEVSSYLVWGWGSQWLIGVALGLMFGWRQYKVVLSRRHLGLVATAGIIRGTMGLFFVFSLVMLKSLCIAVVLAGLRPLFVAFLGAWLLGERKFFVRKVVASLVAGAGVAIMFL